MEATREQRNRKVSTLTTRRRALRSDAIANRERLLDAAVVTIAERGMQVPMAEIAGRAKVGVGTLYRHFATREELFAGLIHRSLQIVLERAETAAAMPGEAIDAIAWFLRETIAHRDQLILPLHGAPRVVDEQGAALQAKIREALAGLLARGSEDGSVRAEVTAADLLTTGAMLAQPLANVDDWDIRADRQTQIFLAGLRPPGAMRTKKSI